MSTRGSYGFRLNKTDYMTYNHYDSYPRCLGDDILTEIKLFQNNYDFSNKNFGISWIEFIKDKAKKVKLVEEIVVDPTRGKCIIFEIQSGQYLNGSEEFLKDSLFCEYAYILNFDREVLEFYKGFNKNPRARGRYAKYQRNPYKNETVPNEYWGVRLVRTYPLDDLPNNIIDTKT